MSIELTISRKCSDADVAYWYSLCACNSKFGNTVHSMCNMNSVQIALIIFTLKRMWGCGLIAWGIHGGCNSVTTTQYI